MRWIWAASRPIETRVYRCFTGTQSSRILSIVDLAGVTQIAQVSKTLTNEIKFSSAVDRRAFCPEQ